ncbi:MAG: Rrf2 family transcriptional regulator [candidate division Zixibacteria bacterium]|nr:Rrf2 family transcriptional regulator [candidate division Zixibacteria bacterium]
MKLSTRARYGLRMMIELARELKSKEMIHIGQIAKITGLSDNYLAQLAISLKNNGLLVGYSGKKGGYRLSRPAEEIKLSEIVRAVTGPLDITECVSNPSICLNSSFCEARLIWALLSGSMLEVLDKLRLSDMVDREKINSIKKEYSHMPFINPDRLMAENSNESFDGCPTKTK